MKLALTAEQLHAIQPMLDQAMQPKSPDILVGQIMRTNWRDGAQVVLDVKLVPRRIADKMRDVFVKEQRQ